MAGELPWQPPGPSGAPEAGSGLAQVPTGAQSGPAAEPTAAERTAAESTATERTAAERIGAEPQESVPGEDYRALLEAASQVLNRVDEALGQLAAGTYGRCRRCGAPVDSTTMAADPTAQHCADHR